MNTIKISLEKIEFTEFIDIKHYQKKPNTRVTMRKYDVMRYLIVPKEERRYE